ncbi:MAG: LamG-like jellyroll fold domain-containing protein [Bacteroidia bacterium]
MKRLSYVFFMVLISGLVLISGCKDKDLELLTITGIKADGTDLQSGSDVSIDLNGAAAAVDVPLDAKIIVTFSRDVDAATVVSANFQLAKGTDMVTSSVSLAGAVVTISPDAAFDRGQVYTLTLGSGIMAADGGMFNQATRTFNSAGRAEVVPPQSASQKAFWKFDGSSLDGVGSYNGTDVAVDYGEDRFGNQGSAAYFDGDASIIEIPNGDQLLTNNWTVSFWIRLDSVGHVGGHFVMGVGDLYGFFVEIQKPMSALKHTGRYQKSDATTTVNDFFINADGKSGDNGGWVGVEYEKDLSTTGGMGALLDRKWAHMVFVYDGSTNKRHFYINGELIETDNLANVPGLDLITGLTFDDSGAGTDVIGKGLAFGFNHDRTTTHWSNEPWGNYNNVDANHFKGALDDTRIFSAALSGTDVLELYNAEK